VKAFSGEVEWVVLVVGGEGGIVLAAWGTSLRLGLLWISAYRHENSRTVTLETAMTVKTNLTYTIIVIEELIMIRNGTLIYPRITFSRSPEAVIQIN
jgi:hypothetical protein